MAKHAFKFLRCEQRKIFKVCLAIFDHYTWKGWCLPWLWHLRYKYMTVQKILPLSMTLLSILFIQIPGAPDAPSIACTQITKNGFNVEWNEPQIYGGNEVGGYHVSFYLVIFSFESLLFLQTYNISHFMHMKNMVCW